MTSSAAPGSFTLSAPKSGVLSRPTLTSRFETEHRARVITLIAPAGYGKTTAAESIISRLDSAHVWIPIDRRCRTLHAFWKQTTRALAQLYGTVDERPLDDLVDGADSDAVEDLVQSIATGLANLDRRHVVGFDDFHDVEEDVLAGVLRLMQIAPPTTTFVVASRHQLAWNLNSTSLSADAEDNPMAGSPVVSLGIDDLVFDRETTRKVLTAASGKQAFDAATVDLVHERSEGWPLAVGLAADAIRLTGTSTSTDLADNVAAGVLERLEETLAPDQHRLLSNVSICSSFTTELANAVSGPDSGDNVDLALLAEQSSVIVTVDGTTDTYRIHHLVGELLAEQVRISNPDLWNQLHGRAAEWYTSTGNRTEEIEHRLAAGQYTRAAEVLIATSADLAVAGRMPLHREWIRRMPDGFLAENPILVAQLAEILAVGGELEKSRQLIDQASRSITDAHHEIWVFAASFFVDWAVGNARSATATFGKFNSAVELHARNNEPAGFPVQQQLLSLAALCHEALGESNDARRMNAWLDRSTASFPGLGSNGIVDGVAARQLATDGYMGLAATRVALTVDEDYGPSKESPLHTDAHVALAAIAWGAGKLNAANRSLITAARLDPCWTELFATIRRILAAQIAASSQRFDRADEMLHNAHAAGAEPEAAEVIGALVARSAVVIYSTHAMFDEALAWSGLLTDHASLRTHPEAWAGYELVAGRPQLVIDRFHASGAGLPRHPLPMIRAGLVLMQALVEVDRHRDAEQLLPALLVSAEQHCLLQPLLDCPTVRDLFDQERAAGISDEFANAIILGKRTRVPPRTSTNAPLPLSEQLSPRELDLLAFLPSRASNRQIANELYISLNTVKTHLKSIYRKLDVSNRDDAVRRCQNLGLL